MHGVPKRLNLKFFLVAIEEYCILFDSLSDVNDGKVGSFATADEIKGVPVKSYSTVFTIFLQLTRIVPTLAQYYPHRVPSIGLNNRK